MKKLFVIISVFGSICTSSLYAQSKTPSAVLASFQNSFTNASDESWSAVKDLYRVDFTFENEKIAAFFASDGDLVASSRSVSLLQIPLTLKSDLKKNFHNYAVSNLIEVNKEDGVIYYATLTNSKSQVRLESNSTGDWVKIF